MATEEAAKPSPIPPYPEVRPLLPARFLFCFFFLSCSSAVLGGDSFWCLDVARFGKLPRSMRVSLWFLSFLLDQKLKKKFLFFLWWLLLRCKME